MNKETALQIAERNLAKESRKLENSCNRKGVTEEELNNVKRNLAYAQYVYDMINESN
jgi:thiaminase